MERASLLAGETYVTPVHLGRDLPAESPPTLQPSRRQLAGPHRRADRAPGLTVVPTILETAAPGEGFDVSECEAEPVRGVEEPDALDPRSVEHGPAVG
jgi:hypothetical protein